MKNNNIQITVIIPVRTITEYVKETVSHLMKQSEKRFEVIIVTDQKEKINGAKVISSGEPTPSYKRNLAAKTAKGKILAFLDDDSFPDKDWLKNALKIFKNHCSGVCGPTLTPPSDSIYQKVSGYILSSWIGSGGAGLYRNKVMPRREVDDYPSVNLLIKKEVFFKVGGFDVNHWPGEDTKLCLDIVKDGGKIIYDPSVLVYHHRRAVFLPHLRQISRYAQRRGYFSKNFPETSLRLGYFLPSFFSYGMIFGFIFSFYSPVLSKIYLIALLIYVFMLFLSGLEVFFKEKKIIYLLLTMAGIFLTHLTYGLIFPFGLFEKNIKTIPHRIDEKSGRYVGG